MSCLDNLPLGPRRKTGAANEILKRLNQQTDIVGIFDCLIELASLDVYEEHECISLYSPLTGKPVQREWRPVGKWSGYIWVDHGMLNSVFMSLGQTAYQAIIEWLGGNARKFFRRHNRMFYLTAPSHGGDSRNALSMHFSEVTDVENL